MKRYLLALALFPLLPRLALESPAQSWTNLGSGVNNTIMALAHDANGNLYGGGYFTTAGGGAANRIAKWNGTSWTNLGSGMTGSWPYVYALACDNNGNLYAAGDFTNAGGVAANRIAKWDGSSWTNLGSGVNSGVAALARDTNGNLYAAGDFTNAGGVAVNHVAKWDGSTWTNLGSGINGGVTSLLCDANGNLYAGGNFTNAGGVAANSIAKWDGSSWTNLGSGITGPFAVVYVMASDNSGNLYAGGNFTNAGGVAANTIAKWDGSSWTNLGSGIGGSWPYVYALAYDNSGNLYAGGNFTNAGGVAVSHIAKWNGSSWTNLGSGMGGSWPSVKALACDDNGNLYVGGYFTAAGGVAANYIAKWGYLGNITILGTNGMAIASGESASVVKGTDFGISTYPHSAVTNTFVITNSDIYVLTINGWTTNGAGADQFIIRGIPAAVSPGSASNFTISFNPALSGVLTARVVMANNSAQSQYVLNLRGTVEKGSQTITFPAIATQNATNSLALAATASSGLPVSFSVGSGPAAINNNIAAFSASGVVSIAASQAGNANWNPAPSVTNTFTVVAIPGVPTGVKASYGTYTDKIRVSWIVPNGAFGYEVWRGTNSEPGLAERIGQTASISFDDTEAVSDVLYYYWVRATNDVGPSAFSSPDIGLRAPAAISLDAPSGVFASDGAYTNKVRVSWNAVSGATSYQVWRSATNNSASASALATTAGITYDDANATTPGMTLYYWVKARNAAGLSAFSQPDAGYCGASGSAGRADLSLRGFLFQPAVLAANAHPELVMLVPVNNGPDNLSNSGIGFDFFLSGNTLFGDEDDQWIGDYQATASINADSFTSVIISDVGLEGITIPNSASGAYYVFARVRHTSAILDPNMTNNAVMRSGAIMIGEAEGAKEPVAGDYDGDRKADPAVYQESTGNWYLKLSGGGYSLVRVIGFGGEGWKPMAGDYDGDAKSDLAVYQESTGNWRLLLSASEYSELSTILGGLGYAPVAGDFNGGGYSDLAVYREATGYWLIIYLESEAPAFVDFGADGYVPVTGDYTGEGVTDLALYQESTGSWFLKRNNMIYTLTGFGGVGYQPIGGDYDGDGKEDLTLYQASTGNWMVRLSRHNYAVVTLEGFGGPEYLPVSGDYDGDRKADLALYNASTATWLLRLSSANYVQVSTQF